MCHQICVPVNLHAHSLTIVARHHFDTVAQTFRILVIQSRPFYIWGLVRIMFRVDVCSFKRGSSNTYGFLSPKLTFILTDTHTVVCTIPKLLTIKERQVMYGHKNDSRFLVKCDGTSKVKPSPLRARRG